jgi:predicted component of type VI protein secretion system
MGLRILLKEFFSGIDFKIREFIPHRIKLAELPQLGSKEKEKAFQLGRHGIIGRTVTDCMGRICVEVGPIDFEKYLDFTPETENASLLRELLDLYVHDGLEYDVNFIIRSNSMGDLPWSDRRLRLGLSFWLGKPKQEFMDVYYTFERFTGFIKNDNSQGEI